MTRGQMIEKIREKVILANNPECKTYEEALKMESKYGDCLLLCNDSLLSECTADQRRALKIGLCATGKITTYDLKECYGEIEKILGLPLTLERVLVALKIVNEKRLKNDISFLQEVAEYNDLDNVSQIEEWMFNQKNETFPFICFQTAFEEWVITTGENQGIVSWQPNKTLENQPEETIKAIYDILFN